MFSIWVLCRTGTRSWRRLGKTPKSRRPCNLERWLTTDVSLPIADRDATLSRCGSAVCPAVLCCQEGWVARRCCSPRETRTVTRACTPRCGDTRLCRCSNRYQLTMPQDSVTENLGLEAEVLPPYVGGWGRRWLLGSLLRCLADPTPPSRAGQVARALLQTLWWVGSWLVGTGLSKGGFLCTWVAWRPPKGIRVPESVYPGFPTA